MNYTQPIQSPTAKRQKNPAYCTFRIHKPDGKRVPHEWVDQQVRSAKSHQEYYTALLALYDREPGRLGVPNSVDFIFEQGRSYCRKYVSLGNPLWTREEIIERIMVDALRFAIKHFDCERGSFVRLFLFNVRSRLFKIIEHDKRFAERHRELERALLLQRRRVGSRPPNEFAKWGLLLTRLVVDQLDSLARIVLVENVLAPLGERKSKAKIALEFGLKENTLKKKYGKYRGRRTSRLGERIKKLITAKVKSLPFHYQRLLVKHLRAEAGLSDGQIELLLGVPLMGTESTPLKSENDLLRLLDWKSSQSSVLEGVSVNDRLRSKTVDQPDLRGIPV